MRATPCGQGRGHEQGPGVREKSGQGSGVSAESLPGAGLRVEVCDSWIYSSANPNNSEPNTETPNSEL